MKDFTNVPECIGRHITGRWEDDFEKPKKD
jgi:hypothetical protein